MVEKDREILLSLDDVEEDDIDSYLYKWQEINDVKEKLEQIEQKLRKKIKIFLKERKWKRYVSKKGCISVRLESNNKEIIDENELNSLLSEAQLAQVTRIIISENLSIITSKGRERLKKKCLNN